MERVHCLYVVLESLGAPIEHQAPTLLLAPLRLERLDLQLWHRIFPPPGPLANALKGLSSMMDIRLMSNFETNIMAPVLRE